MVLLSFLWRWGGGGLLLLSFLWRQGGGDLVLLSFLWWRGGGGLLLVSFLWRQGGGGLLLVSLLWRRAGGDSLLLFLLWRRAGDSLLLFSPRPSCAAYTFQCICYSFLRKPYDVSYAGITREFVDPPHRHLLKRKRSKCEQNQTHAFYPMCASIRAHNYYIPECSDWHVNSNS